MNLKEGDILFENTSMIRYCILGVNEKNVFIMNELLNWDIVSIEECMDSEFIRNESIMSVPYFVKHCLNSSTDLNKLDVVMEEFEKFRKKGINNE